MASRKIGLIAFVVLLLAVFIPIHPVSSAQKTVSNSYDLIAAVNQLRATNGLPALQVDAALMSSAQGHSDYQASIGTWTHEGSGGSRPKDRAMAAGFGAGSTVYISENVAELTADGTLDYLLYTVWSDAVHWNTMINSQYTHVGAGVAQGSNGLVYYTLDVGYIAGNPANYTPGPSYTPATGDQSSVNNEVMPVVTSTPRADGLVVHVVEPGQSLWSIAIAYGVKIDQIRQLNNMDATSNDVWVGKELIISQAATATATLIPSATVPLPTRTPLPTNSPHPPFATRTITPTSTFTPLPPPPVINMLLHGNRTAGIIVLSLCVLGLVGVILTGFRPLKK